MVLEMVQVQAACPKGLDPDGVMGLASLRPEAEGVCAIQAEQGAKAGFQALTGQPSCA